MSGTTTSPDLGRGGAQKATDWNGVGLTPSRSQPLAAVSSKSLLCLSSQRRSSPLTLKTSTRMLAAPSPTTSGFAVSMRRKNSAKLVLVATPLIPETDMWPPLRPSKKSRSTNTGSPSRPRPTASGRPISSLYSALSRSAPVARSTTSPGSGDTQSSGSMRVIATWAERTLAAGRMPSAAIRCVSDSNVAPS